MIYLIDSITARIDDLFSTSGKTIAGVDHGDDENDNEVSYNDNNNSNSEDSTVKQSTMNITKKI